MGHTHVGVEHLFLAIIRDRAWVQVGPPGDARSVLSAALRALGREPLAPQ